MTTKTLRLNLLIDLRRYAEAEAAAREGIGRDPGWAAGYTHLARVLVNRGRGEEAVAAAREGVRKNPKDAWAAGTLACVLNWFGRPKDAVGPARRAIRLDPGYAWGYAMLANVLYNLGRHKEARQAAVDGLRLDPAGESLHRWKGWAEHALKRYPDARATAEAGVRLHPRSDPLLNLLGQVAWSQAERAWFGRRVRLHREADAALAEAVRLDPTQAGYRTARRDNAASARSYVLSWVLPAVAVVVAGVPAAAFTALAGSLGVPDARSWYPLGLAGLAVVVGRLGEPSRSTAVVVPVDRFGPPVVPPDPGDRTLALPEIIGYGLLLLTPFAAMVWLLLRPAG